MTIDDIIANFLRDGQGRIANIAVEMDKIGDDGGYRYAELKAQRTEIIMLMDILYVGDWFIENGYNHIQFGSAEDQWTTVELIKEIELIRYRTQMNEMPFINFTGHYPHVLEVITGGSSSGSSSLPTGNYLDILIADAGGNFIPQSFSNIGGMLEGESINDYFAS